jgi:ABC-type antimicrobial peptide transport system permease subunit
LKQDKPPTHPRALRFLKWFCPDHLHEEIEGDLIQKFHRDEKTFGEGKAKRRLLWNVIRFLRPGILLRNKFSKPLNPFYMFNHFIKIFFRTTCLGLFSLSYFTAVQRTKEVGIRKVLGANVSSIVGLLLNDFIKLIVFANLIAWPLSYLAISKWLEGYAFHIDITLLLFLVPGVIVLLIGMLTVSYHTFRVAQTNPVNVLRLD